MISERELASLPGVKAAREELAGKIAAKAQTAFAVHDRPGGHKIGVKHSGLNSLVYLEGPAPGALEYGHFTRGGGNWVEGIHVLGKASR